MILDYFKVGIDSVSMKGQKYYNNEYIKRM